MDPITPGKKGYVVVQDDYFNFFEFNFVNQTTSGAIIKSLKSQFARHSILDEVRSLTCPQHLS